MQKKVAILASVLVAVLGLSAVYLSISDTESDAITDTVTYHVALSQSTNGNDMSRTINLIINETYFNQIDANHKLKWSYLGLDSPTEYTTITYNTVKGDALCTFKLNSTSDVGTYKLTLNTTSDSKTTLDLTIKCEITVKVEDGLYDRDYNTDPLFIIVKVSLNNGSDLPTALKYTDGSNEHPITNIEIKEGVAVTLTPIITGTDTDPKDFYWYVVDLPHGIAMTKEGVISGVPVASDVDGTDATLYIEDTYGNYKSFTLHIVTYANEIHFDFTYYLYNGDFNSDTPSGENLIYKPSQFMTQRDRTVSLLLLQDYQVSVLVYNDETGAIERMSISGTLVSNNNYYDYYVYKLPTDGTGLYRVEISSIASDDTLSVSVGSFDLYVISRILAVQSEILVGSDGTS